jgi:cobalt-zinc-cadmium efflux system membrane fusion protein
MKRIISLLVACITLTLGSSPYAWAGGGHDHGHGHEHEGEEQHAQQPSKGPHGGKLLEDGDFALELTIFEDDVPPEFRLYPYFKNKPVAVQEVRASIILTRFPEKRTHFEFSAQGDYLGSPTVVDEPHSFDVVVKASYQGKDYSWNYASHEGRTELSKAALEIAKLEFELAGPQEIANVLHVYGRIVPEQNAVAHITPRFPGVIKEIRKQLGDKVQKGEVLAVVESNQSLQDYEIRAQLSGEVIQRHAALGEFVSDQQEIFVVADLSRVWVDFQVYRDDLGKIQKGQSVTIDLGNGSKLETNVEYVAPIADPATQSQLVRAALVNTDGSLRPGLFVSGVLRGAQQRVALAVRREAIQTFRDWQVVYLSDGHIFQAMPVELGRSDPDYVEVLSGIEPGSRYVSRKSFIIKADIEKAGASHDH